MTFRSIVFSALLVGLVAGLFLSLLQQFQVTPIIQAAETFEIAETFDISAAPSLAAEPVASGHSHGEGHGDADAHIHDPEAWAPAEGLERLAFTLLSNGLAAFGFALLLISLMSTRPGGNALTGLLWGAAGYLSVFVAPSFGLHPEIPGMQAAALESRQFWWTLTVALTAGGLAVIVFVPARFKLGGLLLIAIPHLIGAPQTDGPLFNHPDPAAIAALEGLAQDFIQATALVNGAYWLLIGALSGWLVQRYVNASQDR